MTDNNSIIKKLQQIVFNYTALYGSDFDCLVITEDIAMKLANELRDKTLMPQNNPKESNESLKFMGFPVIVLMRQYTGAVFTGKQGFPKYGKYEWPLNEE